MKNMNLNNNFQKIFNLLNENDVNFIKDNIFNSKKLSIIEKLDEFNYWLNSNNENNKIQSEKYDFIIKYLDELYNESFGYSESRYLWIKELKNVDSSKSLPKHHSELLNYFDLINSILYKNKINFFHASGFMGYILVNKKLERYHHDIDLYVNVSDLEFLISAFKDNGFEIEHTYEESKNMYRHGLKIVHDKIEIPIWLSFYEITENKAINECEYYEDKDGNLYTRKNYNSPLCSKLSLCSDVFHNVPYNSMSLDAIYCSKEGNRKKDQYDCNIIENYVDKNKVQIIKNELSPNWNFEEGMPKNVMSIFGLMGNYKLRKLI